jgi:type IV pilus assembly protein PilB
MQQAAQQTDLETLLLREGAVTEDQLTRTKRIAARMAASRPVGEILVELGQLARAEYDRIVRLHRAELSLESILVEDGALNQDGLATFAAAKAKTPTRSDRSILVEGELVTEELYLKALSTKHDIPYLEPEVGLVDMDLLKRTSVPYLMRHHVLPLRVVDGILTAIMADPLAREVRAELERIYGIPVRPCCATSARITEAILTLERLQDGTSGAGGSSLQYREIREEAQEDENGEGAVQIVDYLLLRAIQLGASDLHIEPLQNKIRVRVRVDGVLRNLTDLPADFAPRVISRVKVLAGADIAERRLHQDGRIVVKAEGREVDIRVSLYASMFGETLVLRLLDRKRGLVPLDDLGFAPRVLSTLRDVVLRTSSGLVLVTGPTGSGKTTTLYSFVDYVSDASIKVISCEDPVEYVLDGVTQCSVNSKSGPTFADSLRAIVRQDPDIVVVGEVRDATTSALAVEAALTGHKVLSTFHTEDAVGAVIRLLDMGVEPFLVSSTLAGIVAQRLVRRTCSDCMTPTEPTREDLRFLGLERSDLHGFPLMAGSGCSRCSGTGFRGRLGLHELLLPDDDFRDAVLRRAPSKELRALARQLPAFLTLQEDGLLKAMAGLTSLSEVVTNAPRDTGSRRPAILQEIGSVGRPR